MQLPVSVVVCWVRGRVQVQACATRTHTHTHTHTHTPYLEGNEEGRDDLPDIDAHTAHFGSHEEQQVVDTQQGDHDQRGLDRASVRTKTAEGSHHSHRTAKGSHDSCSSLKSSLISYSTAKGMRSAWPSPSIVQTTKG